MDQKYIRNFAIVAHIDHGKSTLADRLMDLTGTVAKRDQVDQALDSHPISRERGITIKLAPVTMKYTHNGEVFELNLIDTPGHVDFSYEVERSLAACEGVILLVDATQGIQAQTLSHFQKAKKLGLVIIPAINKIDSPIAKTEEVMTELMELVGSTAKIFTVSAKDGTGVAELLDHVISLVPPPNGVLEKPARGLIFSSLFDPKRGVVAFVRAIDGEFRANEKLRFLATNGNGIALEVGRFVPVMKTAEKIQAGEVGFIATNIKDPAVIKVGDTICLEADRKEEMMPLPGYKEPKPVVFVSFFPVDQNDFPILEDGLKKLKLNDAAISFSPTSSNALGRGFRCGFLGHLHAEVSQERLEADYDLNILATSPTVEYRMNGQTYEEPWIMATIIVPQNYLGGVITLCEDRRAKLIDMNYHGSNVTVTYEIPLSEIITDFFDQLKSNSSGFASMDYEFLEYRPFNAVNLEILINHEAIDAFSQIMEKDRAEKFGKFLVERLKDVIPRQQIAVPIQAVINGQVIARADISSFRKDVIAKLYGGDVTRKMKLLEKQKEGKKKMKTIGKVEIPNDTFLKVFRT
jgi:GTP-binding protein LepA